MDDTAPSGGSRASTLDGSRTLTLAATSLGFVVVQLDVTIVNVALQRIGQNIVRQGVSSVLLCLEP